MSPTTPPPSASTVASRFILFETSASSTQPAVCRVLCCSPSGRMQSAICRCEKLPDNLARYSLATVALVTMRRSRPGIGCSKRRRHSGDLRIQCRPALHGFFELLFWIRVVQERPVARVARSFDLLVDRGDQVDHGAPLCQGRAVYGIDHGAAARGEHDRLETREPFDGLPLAQPKAALAFLFENESDVDAGFCLDVRVAVMKGVMKQARQVPAYRRLARAHWTNEKNVALGKHSRRRS